MLTRQWTTYSCGAACLQWVLREWGKACPSHWDAITELGCKPDGTTFERMAKVFKRYGVRARKLRSMSVPAIAEHLGRGELVLINDNATYKNDHFEVLAEIDGDDFLVYDPVWGVKVRRSQDYVLGAADAMYALA